MSKQPITAMIGDDELTFNVGDDDFNRFINEQTPGDKVTPAYNFLSRTVDEQSRDRFRKLALNDEQQPKGLIVMQLVGVITMDFGADVTVTIKKSKPSPTESIRMVGSNFN